MLVEAAPLAAPSAPPPASDPGNAAAARSRLDAFVAEASASVDRLRRHAESARVLAAEARARLDALDGADATLAATLARPRAALRVLARALNARTRDTLAALERAKAIVDAALVAHHRDAETSSETSDRKDDARHAQHASAFAALLEEAEEDGLLAPLPRLPDAPAAEAVVVSDSDASASPRPSHHSSLAARLLRSSSSDAVGPPELAALELIAGGPDAFAADPLRAARLRRAVAALRAAERDVDARARLVAETRAISLSAAAEKETKKYSYTEENFAYGSTPLASWLLVHVACPELLEATRALANDPQRTLLASGRRRSSGDASSSENGFINPSPPERYAVWGSSSGWLVLYAALGLGVRAVGYELLECHVDTARRVARECLGARDDEDRFFLSGAGEKDEAGGGENRDAFARGGGAVRARGLSEARGVGRAGDARRLAHVAVLGPGGAGRGGEEAEAGARERSYSRRLRRPAREGRRGGGVRARRARRSACELEREPNVPRLQEKVIDRGERVSRGVYTQ